jgi:HSP20 family molecular chaperone IbpA
MAPIRSHIFEVAAFGGQYRRLDKDEDMSKLTLGTHPFLLGFDQLERLVERTAKNENGYPPYNIEHVSENAFRITLAVAGFSDEDLSISVEDRQLVVRGQQVDDSEGHVFLHRGIAARQFQRTFLLADGVDVSGAALTNGLLHIDLSRTKPEKIVQKINIATG